MERILGVDEHFRLCPKECVSFHEGTRLCSLSTVTKVLGGDGNEDLRWELHRAKKC